MRSQVSGTTPTMGRSRRIHQSKVTKAKTLVLSVVGTTLFTALAAGSLAWACSEQSYLEVNPHSGRPGAQVTVVPGGTFKPGAPIEIRWNSRTGLLLGTAPGPGATVQVAIPDVPEDVYTMVAMQYVPGTALVSNNASAPFEVSLSAQPQGSGSNVASAAYTGNSGGGTATESKGQAPSNSTSAPSGASSEVGPAPSGDGQTSPAFAASQPEKGVRPLAGVSANRESQQSAPAPAQAPEGAGRVGSPGPAAALAEVPPSRRVIQDLWSGLAPSRSGLGNSNLGSPSPLASPVGSWTLAIGLGLAMFAAVLGGAAFAVALVHRRRRRAFSTHSQRQESAYLR